MIVAEINKSSFERIFQAVIFEIIANLIITFSISAVMGVGLITAGTLSFFSVLISTGWNYLYNLIFDYIQRTLGFTRSFSVRIIHAIFFEAGLLAILIPCAGRLLTITNTRACYIEIILAIFFIPYTFLFNIIYDLLRGKLYNTKPL